MAKRRLSLAQRALVEDQDAQRMVGYHVRHFAGRYANADRDELAGLANEALVLAALRYDATHEASFATYAATYVHGHLFRALNKERLLRSPSCRAMLDAASSLPSLDASADASPADYRAQLVEVLAGEAVGMTVAALQAAASPELALVRKRLRRQLAAALAALPADDAQLVTSTIGEGRTLAEMEAEFGRSSATLSRARRAALVRLRHAFAASGVDAFPVEAF